MNRFREYADVLFEKAVGDLRVLERLIGQPDLPVWAMAFHAQQAVEKFIKAVLTSGNVPFPHTHDLRELMELLEQEGMDSPPQAENLSLLTPYGALLRYVPPSDETLDVDWALTVAREVEAWAREQLGMKP